jgi:mitogen-activated protein kinase kinase kinase 3
MFLHDFLMVCFFLQVKIETSSYRSLSPLRDPDILGRNLPGPTSPIPSTSSRRIAALYVLLRQIYINLHIVNCVSTDISFVQEHIQCSDEHVAACLSLL